MLRYLRAFSFLLIVVACNNSPTQNNNNGLTGNWNHSLTVEKTSIGSDYTIEKVGIISDKIDLAISGSNILINALSLDSSAANVITRSTFLNAAFTLNKDTMTFKLDSLSTHFNATYTYKLSNDSLWLVYQSGDTLNFSSISSRLSGKYTRQI